MSLTIKKENAYYQHILAVVAGQLCLWLSVFSIEYQFGEVLINIPWSLVFPVVISLAYGKKASIVTAFSGAAFYQFILWPNNGYANLSNTFIFTTFYFMLGYFSEYSRQKGINKKVVFYIILFSFGYATLFFLTFRYLFNIFLSFNPPFWEKNSINHMPINVLYSIIAKNLINYALIALFSDTLLKLPEIRKLLRLPVKNTMRRNSWIFITSVSGAFLIWSVFYLLDTLLVENGNGTKDYIALSFMVIMWSSSFAAWSLIRFSESRIKAQNELKDSREYIKSIIENVPSVVFRCLNDERQTVKLISQQITRLTGYEVNDFIDNSKLSFENLIHPDEKDSIRNSIREQLIENQKFEIESRIIDKTGKVHWILAKGIIQENENDTTNYIDGAILDITEKKNTEKELKTYREHLEKLVDDRTAQLKQTLDELKKAQLQLVQTEKMASLGILTAGVAHEINNPLNFIQTGLHALEENLKHEQQPEDLQKKIATLISGMKKGVTRTANIVKALNTFSRKGNSLTKACDIKTIFNNCLLILNHEIKNKCVVNLDFTNNPYLLEANEDGLHQVFTNLIMNAVQSIQSKGEIRISSSVDKEKKQLIIKISDNGEGISKEHLPKIFDPFFTTKAPGKGVGIGLSIVYNIIEEHKGTISYQSEINKGTTVTIALPVKFPA